MRKERGSVGFDVSRLPFKYLQKQSRTAASFPPPPPLFNHQLTNLRGLD